MKCPTRGDVRDNRADSDVCFSYTFKTKSDDDLKALSQRCAQANVYSSLVLKKVQVWIATRNKPDHGQFNEYGDADVEEMLKGVQDFLADHLR